MRLRSLAQIGTRFRECDVKCALPFAHPFACKLHGQRGLPSPWVALDEIKSAARESSVEDVVQARTACADSRISLRIYFFRGVFMTGSSHCFSVVLTFWERRNPGANRKFRGGQASRT